MIGGGTAMARVRITRHARERAEERLPDIKISPGRLNQQIYGALRAGRKVRRDGTIAVPVGQGWCAICAPEARGGWVAITFLRERSA